MSPCSGPVQGARRQARSRSTATGTPSAGCPFCSARGIRCPVLGGVAVVGHDAEGPSHAALGAIRSPGQVEQPCAVAQVEPRHGVERPTVLADGGQVGGACPQQLVALLGLRVDVGFVLLCPATEAGTGRGSRRCGVRATPHATARRPRRAAPSHPGSPGPEPSFDISRSNRTRPCPPRRDRPSGRPGRAPQPGRRALPSTTPPTPRSAGVRAAAGARARSTGGPGPAGRPGRRDPRSGAPVPPQRRATRAPGSSAVTRRTLGARPSRASRSSTVTASSSVMAASSSARSFRFRAASRAAGGRPGRRHRSSTSRHCIP